MRRVLAVIYACSAYIVFLATVLYAIGFVTGLAVPKAIAADAGASVGTALIIDMVLLALFALQQIAMARASFMRWWTRYIPNAIERSTYVLLASLALDLLLWQWRSIPGAAWQAMEPSLIAAMTGLSFLRLARGFSRRADA